MTTVLSGHARLSHSHDVRAKCANMLCCHARLSPFAPCELPHTAGHCPAGSECPASAHEEEYIKVGRVEKRVISHKEGKSRGFWAPQYVKLTRTSINLSLSEDSDTREIIDLLDICVAESVEEDLDKGFGIRSIPSELAGVPEASLRTRSSRDKKDPKDSKDEDRPELKRSFSRKPSARKSALVTTCVIS